MKRLSACFAVTLLTVLRAAALKADDCCERCGCVVCRRVARVVRELKKVSVTVYTYEAGGESDRGDRLSTPDCCAAPHVGSVAALTSPPKLVKRNQIKEVPTYKWVVEYLCEDCATTTECREIEIPLGQLTQSTLPAAHGSRLMPYHPSGRPLATSESRVF